MVLEFPSRTILLLVPPQDQEYNIFFLSVVLKVINNVDITREPVRNANSQATPDLRNLTQNDECSSLRTTVLYCSWEKGSVKLQKNNATCEIKMLYNLNNLEKLSSVI